MDTMTYSCPACGAKSVTKIENGALLEADDNIPAPLESETIEVYDCIDCPRRDNSITRFYVLN